VYPKALINTLINLHVRVVKMVYSCRNSWLVLLLRLTHH